MYDIISESSAKSSRIDILHEIEKFNPYHDARGRFASANSAASFTYSPGKSKAHDMAIERERRRIHTGAPLTNPSGDYNADLKREWDGADYAVQFRGDGRYGAVDLHSTETDGHGNLWAEGAYGNMKTYAANDAGSQIYMMDKNGYKAAVEAANRQLRSQGARVDRKTAVSILESEVKRTSVRTITRDYINEQTAKARGNRK